MRKLKLIACLLCFTSLIHAQNITKMEYWVDIDPGFSAGIDITGFSSSPNISAHPFTVPSSIGAGIHTIGVRTKDANNLWSHSNMFPVMVLTPPANTSIDSIEYFFNTDSNFGAGTQVIGFSVQPDIQNLAVPIPTNLTAGIHTVGFRSRDSDGNWSHTNFFPVYILDTTAAGVIDSLEYFWDSDTGFSANSRVIPTHLVLDLNSDIMNAYVPLSFSSFPSPHVLFVRSHDRNGVWSHTNYIQIFVDTNHVGINELKAETGISIYPNPISTEFNISSIDNSKFRLIIYDINGKLIIDQWILEKSVIDMHAYSPGTYVAYIWKGLNTIHTIKLLKQ